MTNVTCFDTEPDSASLGSQPCNEAGAPFRIFIPNASTQGPTTSGAVQINRGNFMGAGGCAEGGRVHIQQDFTGAFTGVTIKWVADTWWWKRGDRSRFCSH